MTSRVIFEQVNSEGKKIQLYGSETGDLELYTDGAWGLMFANGTCKVNLYTVADLGDPTDSTERRDVVARLAMPLHVFLGMREFFNKQCDELVKAGVGGP